MSYLMKRITDIIYRYAQQPLKNFKSAEAINRMAKDIMDNAGILDRVERDDIGDLSGTIFKVPIVIPYTDDGTLGAPSRGSMYVTVAGHEGRPLEVFVTLGKAGGDAAVMADCIARLISSWLQDGATVDRVLKHLVGMSSGARVGWPRAGEGAAVLSVPDGIGKALLLWVESQGVRDTEEPEEPKQLEAPEEPKQLEAPKDDVEDPARDYPSKDLVVIADPEKDPDYSSEL